MTSIEQKPEQFASAFKDQPWEVLVGEEKSIVYIHPSILIKSSSILKTRLTGSWTKSTENVIDWSYFDHETIECAINFLYSGKYEFIGASEEIESHDGVSEPDPGLFNACHVVNTISNSLAPRPMTKLEKHPRLMTSQISPHAPYAKAAGVTPSRPPSQPQQRVPLAPGTAAGDTTLETNGTSPSLHQSWRAGANIRSSPTPTPNGLTEKTEGTKSKPGLGDIILLHAKVYTFAHEYLFTDLIDYSLDALNGCFERTEKVSIDMLPSLVKAIQRIYAEAPSPELGENKARKAITDFVVANHTKLIVGNEVDTFSEAGDAFIGDLTRALTCKLIEKEELVDVKNEEIRKLETRWKKRKRS